jgi:hypothetical protein
MEPPLDAEVAFHHWGAHDQTVVRPSVGFTIQAFYPPKTAKKEGVTAVYSMNPQDPYVLEHHRDLAASQVTFANPRQGTRLAFSVGRDDTRDTAFVTVASPSIAMQVALPRGKHQVRLVLDETKTGKDSIKAEKRLREGENNWTLIPNCDYYDIGGTEVSEVDTRKSNKSARWAVRNVFTRVSDEYAYYEVIEGYIAPWDLISDMILLIKTWRVVNIAI